MLEPIQEPNIKRNDIVEQIDTPYISSAQLKEVVLNYLFRNICFFPNHNNKERIRVLSSADYNKMSQQLKLPILYIHKIVSKFLIKLYYYRKFLKVLLLNSQLKTHDKKLRVQLHRIHRMAPIFDYKRARENANRLVQKIKQINRWSHITTQIAFTIYITDLLDINITRPIIQANLRALCYCSAYAFHGIRNKLGLQKKFNKNISK